MESTFFSVDQLGSLFRDIHSLYELTARLTDQSKNLREISVNAAIASGHVGNQAKVTSEIAKQIERISTQISVITQRAQNQVSRLSATVLQCLVISNKKEKLDESLLKVEDPKNRALVWEVCRDLWQNIDDQLSVAKNECAYLKPEFQTILQVVNRIWATAVSLKVLAGLSPAEEQGFFLSISAGLEKTHSEISMVLEKLDSLMMGLAKMLECGAPQVEREIHAA